MMRTWMASVGLVVCGLLVAGCDSTNSAAKKVEEGAKKAASEATEGAKKAAGEAKEVAKQAAGEAKEVAKQAAGEAKEVAKAAKEKAKEAADAAKLAVLKPVEEALPKIEEKIKGLSGESATKAKEKFEEFKKLLEQFKSAAPEKWESLKAGLMKSFDELKKLVGIDK
jgi:DNA anti-recombination protein RmuC